MFEKEVEVFERKGGGLVDTGTRIALGGGGAAIRTAER
jgi:hypothetical protein